VPYPAQLLAALASETAARLTGRRPRLTRMGVVSARKYLWIYDGSRIGRELGFSTRTGLREAIRETIEWHREHGWD
jgi:nucleoside-diphosphate-sugar epimerase